MAAENEVQFFEAPFDYSIGEFKSNVNQSYHKLINTRPIKIPFYNTGFETGFSPSYNEKGDKAYFAIKKREGFRKRECDESIDRLTRTAWLSMGCYEGYGQYVIEDHVVVDGRRFLFVTNSSHTAMCVLTQEPGNYIGCERQPQDPEKGEWKLCSFNGNSRGDGLTTTPCSYHKFQKIPALWNDEYVNKHHIYIGDAIFNGGSTTAVLYNDKRTKIEGLNVGDFIQVTKSDDTNMVVGQALQVGKFDEEHGWYNMGYGSWIGITGERNEPIYDKDGDEIGTLNYQGEADCRVYKDVHNSVAITGSGIRSDNQYGIREWDGRGFSFIEQTRLKNTNITSMASDFGGLVYTTNKGYIYFLRPAQDSFQNNGGTIYSTNKMFSDWDCSIAIRDYIVLVGPNSMGIAYKSAIDERGDPLWHIQYLDRDLGYYNKDSVIAYQEGLYMIDNKRRFIKIDMTAQQVTNIKPIFEIQVTDMSLHRVNTDFRNISKENGDRVCLAKDDYRIYVIIQDNYDKRDDGESQVCTKILVYEDELKYRHRRYLDDIDIRHFADKLWIGRGVRLNEGNKDNGKSFKQIISLTFGDTSRFTRKEILWTKLAFGYHSKISRDTVFKFRVDGGGYSNTMKMTNLHETTEYLKMINSLRESGKTDEYELVQSLYKNMPIGLGIFAGNGVGLEKDIERSTLKEFELLEDYEDPKIYKIDKCCDRKPADRVSDNGCTMKAPDSHDQNFGSDRFQYHYNVAKYATTLVRMNQQGQNFYMELIANGEDEIEFLGFMIAWMFMDNNFDSFANMPYYQTTPENSLPGNIGFDE